MFEELFSKLVKNIVFVTSVVIVVNSVFDLVLGNYNRLFLELFGMIIANLFVFGMDWLEKREHA